MREVTDPDKRRIRDTLVERGLQTLDQATAATLADFHCEYCDLDFLDANQPDNYHRWVGWDHLIPSSKGGANNVDNLVCSCAICNLVKGAWNPRHDQRFHNRSDEPTRDELVRAARDHIDKKKRCKDRWVQENWRAICRGA